jgi:molybdopterin synthase catalytic subunit
LHHKISKFVTHQSLHQILMLHRMGVVRVADESSPLVVAEGRK